MITKCQIKGGEKKTETEAIQKRMTKITKEYNKKSHKKRQKWGKNEKLKNDPITKNETWQKKM